MGLKAIAVWTRSTRLQLYLDATWLGLERCRGRDVDRLDLDGKLRLVLVSPDLEKEHLYHAVDTKVRN